MSDPELARPARPVTAAMLAGMPLPEPAAEGSKEHRGRVLVIGGGVAVPGAVLLAATAALRAGAGKLQIATSRSVALQLALAVPEALVIGLDETAEGEIAVSAAVALTERAQKCDAVVIGPGMLDEDAAGDLTRAILGEAVGPAYLIDAGAMARLTGFCDLLGKHEGRIVITPHAGEMAHLLGIDSGEIARDPLATARAAAAQLGCIVALKGACTFIATPQGEAWSCAHGNVGLATSGSGDTLAGIIGGLLARGTTPIEAAIWGVFLHGEAGNRLARAKGPIGFLARELSPEIPSIMGDLGRATTVVPGFLQTTG